MKFVQRDLGAARDVSSGGGRRGWWREVLIVVGATCALVTIAYFAIGWGVEWLLPRISVEREQAWFGGFRPDGLVGTAADGDTSARDRAELVLRKLAAQPGVPALDYRLLLLSEKRPNAFAFPGGTIGVTTGLLEIVGDDEVALAFVLGHELGHFAQRDHLRIVGRQAGRGLVWAVLFGDGGGELLTRQLPALLDLRHSRAAETGADRFGVRLVHEVYGTTKGTDRLFVWLEQRERLPAWTAMLVTHPAPAGRLRALREFAAELDAADKP